jgi:ATP-binding cassette subfamily C (CFTR/MRP) protein 1
LVLSILQGCNIGGNFWLSIWAEDKAASTDSALRNKYLGVYGALGFMQSISVLVAVIVITIGTLRSSVKVGLYTLVI